MMNKIYGFLNHQGLLEYNNFPEQILWQDLLVDFMIGSILIFIFLKNNRVVYRKLIFPRTDDLLLKCE